MPPAHHPPDQRPKALNPSPIIPPALIPPPPSPPALIPPALIPPALIPPVLIPPALIPPDKALYSLGPPWGSCDELMMFRCIPVEPGPKQNNYCINLETQANTHTHTHTYTEIYTDSLLTTPTQIMKMVRQSRGEIKVKKGINQISSDLRLASSDAWPCLESVAGLGKESCSV